MLLVFSKLIIMSHRAVLRGGIEHVGKSIIPNVKMSYLLASVPFIFAETFDLLKETNPPVMFPLLQFLYIIRKLITYLQMAA